MWDAFASSGSACGGSLRTNKLLQQHLNLLNVLSMPGRRVLPTDLWFDVDSLFFSFSFQNSPSIYLFFGVLLITVFLI
jgi:hypothetical protein